MNTPEDQLEEQLMAYVDGELDAQAAAAFEQAMHADPALARKVARAQALRTRVRATYAPVADEPVPQRLLDAAGARDNVVQLQPRARPARHWPQWGALAASLALGFVVSTWIHSQRPSDMRMADDGLHASGDLARTLDRSLASAAGTDRIAPGLSFVAQDGRMCRTFTVRDARALAGLACRTADQWRIEAVASGPADGGELRQASSSLPAAVLAAVDERIEGEPMDAESERRARDAGWRR